MNRNYTIIIDTGLSNLHSIQAACAKCNLKFKVSSIPDEIKLAKAIILPGVGSYVKGVKNLKDLKIFEILREVILKGIPTLGICLGMQLLLNESEEFGFTKGLSLINGKVKKFNFNSNILIKVPHIGWSSIAYSNNNWKNSILERIDNLEKMYFIHSYYVELDDQKQILSETIYGDFKFCSSFKYENIYATQFHPEKSGTKGLMILKKFKEIFKL